MKHNFMTCVQQFLLEAFSQRTITWSNATAYWVESVSYKNPKWAEKLNLTFEYFSNGQKNNWRSNKLRQTKHEYKNKNTNSFVQYAYVHGYGIATLSLKSVLQEIKTVLVHTYEIEWLWTYMYVGR